MGARGSDRGPRPSALPFGSKDGMSSALAWPGLAWPGLAWPGLACPALPCPALPCPALPCPALPCPAALRCPLLPCPAALPCCPVLARRAALTGRGPGCLLETCFSSSGREDSVVICCNLVAFSLNCERKQRARKPPFNIMGGEP